LIEAKTTIERRAITVEGIVQGVGFRPFIKNLAEQWNLVGSVRNQHGSVRIEVEGPTVSIEAFIHELVQSPPPLSQIKLFRQQSCPIQGDNELLILDSQSLGSSQVYIPADVATCADCLRELFDDRNRRYRYPFINCTNCGPRLTIIRSAPYDRARTTMAGFRLCEACAAEYRNPRDRRFHAEPIACQKCGPKLELRGGDGKLLVTDNPLADFAARILAGQIGALKGIGGFHLVCDARNHSAVQELRRRKGREEKPLAVMVRDLADAHRRCLISPAESTLLSAPQRDRPAPSQASRWARRRCENIARAVAPRCPFLGVLLPTLRCTIFCFTMWMGSLS
jgi:hydrogenase maturation protein HypF